MYISDQVSILNSRNVKQQPNSKNLLFFNHKEMLPFIYQWKLKMLKPAFNKLNEFTHFDNLKNIYEYIRTYSFTNLDKRAKNTQ